MSNVVAICLAPEDQRVATNGDVRLSPTPAQWDPIPQFKNRRCGPSANELIAFLAYPEKNFSYQIDLQPEPGGFRIAVELDQPLPVNLQGKAGFDPEFLPTAYFGKSFMLDGFPGIFPGFFTILQPDFPELKSDWPFLWYENEYVVDTATDFILAANAASRLAQ